MEEILKLIKNNEVPGIEYKDVKVQPMFLLDLNDLSELITKVTGLQNESDVLHLVEEKTLCSESVARKNHCLQCITFYDKELISVELIRTIKKETKNGK